MLKQIHRPSPAMAISLIALFAALGGGAYAASGKIDGKSIMVKSIPGNRLKTDSVTGKQVKESSLARVPKAEQAIHAQTAGNAESAVIALSAVSAQSAQTAQTAHNADKVGGHEAACLSGTQLFLGGCWESAPRSAATAGDAASTCTGLGGSLPHTYELVAFSKVATLGNTEEWTDDINTVTAEDTYTAITVSKTGSINFTNSTATKEYRCVFPLLR